MRTRTTIALLAAAVALAACSSRGGKPLPPAAGNPPGEAAPASAPARPSADGGTADDPRAVPHAAGVQPAALEKEPSGTDGSGRRLVEFICREAWGAKAPTGEYRRHTVRLITVHHSGVHFDDAKRAARRMRTMQRYHQTSEKKFADVSYHFVIDPAGNVWEGRPTWAPGETLTDYDPTDHLLVCLLGNFEEQIPPAAQVEALVDVLAWASGEFGVSPDMIQGHRDHARTSCPGANLHRLLTQGSLRQRVEERLAGGPVELRKLCGPEASSRVERIERKER